MTFSIVARDPETGAFGVATATAGPVGGSLVPHARAGVGAIATQAHTNGLYAYDGLDWLAEPGAVADTVLRRLLAGDAGRDNRQCILIDRQGRTAAWTGPACGGYAGALTAPDVAVAGNLLPGPGVLEAMMTAFQPSGRALEDRLLAALAAGQARGGDRRGTRSAALKIYTTEPYPAIDLRADWSETPIEDLAAILGAVRSPGYAVFFGSIPTRAQPGRAPDPADGAVRVAVAAPAGSGG